ncbi:signal peptidase subunit-domain-containing protein [Boeremia exigua]|uniref:signal peptidase subunit-domain-containing protein n=1 Tax=Boeremia exigua TaxID=749465 RepID=UPI001E8CC22E|nr:signal peptidase subunit-domain-containing protein [Boeremia exigua]KAH6639067.1 signal peptidase subunit-domain-containing protein [Boeremia exigua]
MHSALVRLQNVFGFFTTVAFTIAAVIALSSFVSPQAPSATVALRNVQVVKGRPHYYSYKKEEYAHIKFDLDTDLTSLFNWNTKQVFLYLKAVYPGTPSEPASEAIIWDAIVASSSAPWHQNHYIHPSKSSKLPKQSKKALAAAKKTPVSPYPIGELHLKQQRPKYQITDISGKLQNKANVTLELGWNVQPWVGALTWTTWQTAGVWKGLEGGRSESFGFPEIGKKVDAKELKTEKGAEGYRLEVGGEVPRRKAQ